MMIFFLIHQPEIGGSSWKWLFPVKVSGNSGLPVAGSGATGGSNVFVHSVCLCYRWNRPWGGPARRKESHGILWVRGERRQQRGDAEGPTAHALRHDLWLCLPQRYSERPEGSPVLCSQSRAHLPPGSLSGEGPGCQGSPVRDIQPCKLSWDLHAVGGTLLVAGTAAMRNTKRGSWYIEALTQVFSERACDMHVADMLVKVSHLRPALSAQVLPSCLALSVIVSSLPLLPTGSDGATVGFCLRRWTRSSRSVRATPLARSSTAARRCPSTVAPCAAPSTCSRATLPRDAVPTALLRGGLMGHVLFWCAVSLPPQGLGICGARGAPLPSPPACAGPRASPSCGSSLPVERTLAGRAAAVEEPGGWY